MRNPGQPIDAASLLAPPHTGALTAMLTDPVITELLRGPWPPMIAACGPEPKVVWATPQALALFGAQTLAELSARLFAGGAQGAARLAGLAVSLPPGGKPRLERLRFPVGPLALPLTCLVKRYSAPGGGALFAAAVLGHKPDVPGCAPATPMDCAVVDDAAFVRTSLPLDVAPPQPQLTRAQAATELDQRFAGRRTPRFVWQTNAADELVAVGTEMALLLGDDGAPVAGARFDTCLAAGGIDPDGAARAALASRKTWSGIETFWPVFGGAATVPVTLGAVPVSARDHGFEGYRGYGLILLERLTGNDDHAAAAPGLPPADGLSALERILPIVLAPASARLLTETESPAIADAVEDPVAVEAVPGFDSGTDFEVDAPQDPTLHTAQDETGAGESAPLRSLPLSAGFVLLRKSALLIPASQAGPNVVPIRPGIAATPPVRPMLRTVRPDDPARTLPGESVALSSIERSAFREIARALGARTHDDPPGVAETGEPVPEPAGLDAASPTPLTQEAGLQEAGLQEAGLQEAGLEDLTPDELPPEDFLLDNPPPDVSQAAPAPDAGAPVADMEADSLRRNAPGLLDRLPVGIIVCRGDVPIFINRTQLDFLGYENADDFYTHGGVNRMFRGRQPEALDPGALGGTVPVIAADGEVLSVDARLQSIDWDGLPATLITFRRAAEPEAVPRLRAMELDLRAREDELRELNAILDTATDGVAVMDEAGQILSLNRSAEAVFGYDLNEVAGEPFTLLFAQASHGQVKDYFDKLKGDGPASVLNEGREVTGRERQGGAMPLFLTLGRIGQRGTAKFCAVLRDLTQFRRAERELGEARRQAEKASERKSDFLAKVSHEIRTPLNSILGFTEVIMDERLGPVGNDRYKDYLKDIHASGSHVLSLVNDLLDLSKIEAGKADMNFIAVDANRIISESVSLMQPQAAKVRVIMRLSLAGALPSVVADERSLRQIVLNLLSNAIKFTEPGGQVIVSTAMTENGNAVIRVKDTGIGMTEEEIGIALEPFRQIASTRKTVGTGLGLPLTKALIEANRASLSIKSRRNEGTLIEVTFPATRVLAE